MRRNYITLVAVAVPVFILPLLVDNAYYLSVISFIGIYSMVVLGLNLLMGYAGQISLGHAAFFGLGAYLSGVLMVHANMNGWLAMALAVLITGVVAYFLGLPTFRLKGHYLAMATLGLGIVIQLIFTQEYELTGGPSGMGIPPLKIGSFEFDTNFKFYYLIWGVLAALVILSINLVHSRIGRSLRALHGSDTAASVMGVHSNRLKLSIFALSAVYGAIAGCLYAPFNHFISPTPFNFMASVKLVTMVVIGGTGSIWGSLIGAALIISLPEYLTVIEDYEMMVYGAILVVCIIFAPKGIAGLLGNLFNRSEV